jgi:D-glycero-D-manno-heptose 1,7-bisphosphate phosphatase
VDRLDAVFLDRDGTINVKPPPGCYVTSPSELRLLPGAGNAVRAINQTGALVLVVTNQRGVALGKMTIGEVHVVNNEIARRLARAGATIDGFYVCPHGHGVCQCRKPAAGLLLQASHDHPQVQLARSVMIGDSETDVEAAMAGGACAIRLGPPGTRSVATRVCVNLVSAVARIVSSPPGREVPNCHTRVFPTTNGYNDVN